MSRKPNRKPNDGNQCIPENRLPMNCPHNRCSRRLVWTVQGNTLLAPKGEGCIVCITPKQFAKYLPYITGLRGSGSTSTITKVEEGDFGNKRWTTKEAMDVRAYRIHALQSARHLRQSKSVNRPESSDKRNSS